MQRESLEVLRIDSSLEASIKPPFSLLSSLPSLGGSISYHLIMSVFLLSESAQSFLPRLRSPPIPSLPLALSPLEPFCIWFPPPIPDPLPHSPKLNCHSGLCPCPAPQRTISISLGSSFSHHIRLLDYQECGKAQART